MHYLYALTAVALTASLVADRAKTGQALRIAATRLGKILPAFLLMLALVSIGLFLVPDEVILRHLSGRGRFTGAGIAGLIGSVSLMPGFIAFPLSGLLLDKGVSYMVLSAFTTTAMMVGVLTYPVEREYLGTQATVLRNLLGLLIAAVVAVATGLCYGELVQ